MNPVAVMQPHVLAYKRSSKKAGEFLFVHNLSDQRLDLNIKGIEQAKNVLNDEMVSSKNLCPFECLWLSIA